MNGAVSFTCCFMCGAWKCPSAELLMPLPKQNEREKPFI